MFEHCERRSFDPGKNTRIGGGQDDGGFVFDMMKKLRRFVLIGSEEFEVASGSNGGIDGSAWITFECPFRRDAEGQ